jgi:hypothetical protein
LSIPALDDGGERQSVRLLRGQILEAVDGDVDAAVEKSAL